MCIEEERVKTAAEFVSARAGTLSVLVLLLMSPNVFQPVLVNLTSLLFQTQCLHMTPVSLFVCHLDFFFSHFFLWILLPFLGHFISLINPGSDPSLLGLRCDITRSRTFILENCPSGLQNHLKCPENTLHSSR